MPAAIAPSCVARDRFERARRRRADGDDAPAVGAGAVDRGRGGRADLVALRFDAVILDPIDADRLKGAVADMEGDLGDLHAAVDERRRQLGREVQAGGRRGDRAARPGEDRLVAVAIVVSIVDV